MSDRFFVDDRSGCVAVRDRLDTNPDDQGLWPETMGVVKFWGKEHIKKECPTCGHTTSSWGDGDDVLAKATALASYLNAKEDVYPEFNGDIEFDDVDGDIELTEEDPDESC